jgi:hypothetical protein
MAWDGVNRLIIAPVNRLPAIIRLLPRAERDPQSRAETPAAYFAAPPL